MTTYTSPVDNARQGWKFRERSLTWPLGHPGVDLLPLIPRDRQDVRAAASGRMIQYVGGTCQGFDWQDDNGVYHRYCHQDIFIRPGDTFKGGQVISQMAPKGFIVPPGTTHLHWVAAKDAKFRNQIDPLSLVPHGNEQLAKADIRELFRQIWHREGAKGEIAVFETERRRGKYKDYRNLINTMTYWFQQVYPDGVHLSHQGDAKWQRKKEKVLL